MEDEFEAKTGTEARIPTLLNTLSDFAFGQAEEFIICGHSAGEAASICANIMLIAAWEVAASGEISDGRKPDKDRFRARVEEVFERVKFADESGEAA